MAAVDFKAQLNRQLSFLSASSEAFDNGFRDEGIRIATTIRVLVHNTPSSTSLLKHLNATTINLVSTCEGATERTIMYSGLAGVKVGNGKTEHFASLGDGPIQTLVPVSKWWDQVVFVVDKTRLSRRKIVLAAANQDGGAHVDAKLNADYEALISGPLAWKSSRIGDSSDPGRVIEAQHLFALRQMAYELLNSPALLALK